MFTRNIRKKYIQIWICTGLLLCLMINLVGCKIRKEEPDKSLSENNEYYEKISLEVPENCVPMHFINANQGGLYVVTKTDFSADTVWYFDGENNWEKKYDLYDVLNIDKNSYCNAYVSSNGEIFAIYNDEIEIKEEAQVYSNKMKYCFIDEAGNKTDISIDLPKISESIKSEHSYYFGENNEYVNYIDIVKYCDNKIYMSDINGNIYEMDNNNVKCVFENTTLEYIDNFSVVERTIIIWSNEFVGYEGLDGHEYEKNMSDKYTPFFANAKQFGTVIQMNVDENNKMWTLSGDKISSFDICNNEVSHNKALGYSEKEYIFEFANDNEDFYALASNYDNSNIELYKYQLCDNSGNNDTVNVTTGSIKIWVLRSSVLVDEAVRCFTDMYPNVNVEIEVGFVADNSGQTESDVIKKLNADILSGNGPDVIYMDGLNIDKYFDDDKLYDMSGLIDEIQKDGDYFDNVIKSFEREGKVYVVPSSITIVAKTGTEESMKKSENYSEFCNYILEQESKESVLSHNSKYQYIEAMYFRDVYETLRTENPDKEKITEFFEVSKNIWDSIEGDKLPINTKPYYVSNNAFMFDGNTEMALDFIGDAVTPYIYMNKMAMSLNGDYELPANDFANKYIVNNNIAISANAKNLDLAQKYVKCALSENCQSGYYGAQGFAVNKKAMYAHSYDLYLNTPDHDHEHHGDNDATLTDASAASHSIDVATNTDTHDDFEEYMMNLTQKIENMNEPIYVDINFNNIIFGELNRYLQGDVGIDDAVDSVIEKLHIYMSE